MLFFFWKPPAFAILFFSGLVNFVWFYLIKLVIPQDQQALRTRIAIVLWTLGTGLCIFGCDVYYRRRQLLSAWDREESTVYWLFPTWLIGVLLFLFGLVGASKL